MSGRGMCPGTFQRSAPGASRGRQRHCPCVKQSMQCWSFQRTALQLPAGLPRRIPSLPIIAYNRLVYGGYLILSTPRRDTRNYLSTSNNLGNPEHV